MRDIIYYYLVLFVIIHFLTGCSSPTESEPVSPPSNYGSADISTNTDSALIAIKIGNLTLKNRVGDGTIDSLLEGNYLLVVAKNGYRSDSSVIQISKGNRMVKHVLLNGDPNFDGSILVATNISGSQNISLKRRNSTYYLLLEGSPKAGITSDEYDLIIEAPGYETDSSKIKVYPKSLTSVQRIVKPAPNYIGSLEVNTNVPASKIELYTGSIKRTSYGYGLFDSLVSGNYRLVITADGYEKYDSTVQVNANSRTVKSINLSTVPIIGNWLSEGDNVARGLRIVSKTQRVLAKFKSDFTYEIVSTDSSGTQVRFEGTYSYHENQNISILSIKLMQNVPSVTTNEGIFVVTNQGILSMEYTQTNPVVPGFTPPTPAEGFGSTKYNGVSLGQTWIQKFVRN